MEHNLKALLNNISKSSFDIVQNHVKELIVNENSRYVILYIDKLYVINEIYSDSHIKNIIKVIKKLFWNDYWTIIKFNQWNNKIHEREKLIPHTIHFF